MLRSSGLVWRVLFRRFPMHAHKASTTASVRPGQDMPNPPILVPMSSSGTSSTWLQMTAAALGTVASPRLGLMAVNTSQHISSTQAQYDKMENKMDSLENKMESRGDQMQLLTRAQLDMMDMRARLQDLRVHCLGDSVPDDPKSLLFALKATKLNKLKTEEDGSSWSCTC